MATPYNKILILGASGFIGRHLLGRFGENHHYSSVSGFSSTQLDLANRQDILQFSDSLDNQSIVIVCSAIKKAQGDTQETFDKNMKMTSNLIQLFKCSHIAGFVYFSSAAVYGENQANMAIDEETKVSPATYYGIAKYASERLLMKVSVEHGDTPLLILRPSIVYGPGDESEPYRPASFIRDILGKRQITLWGQGDELRDFIYIDDVVSATEQLVTNGQTGLFNLACGKAYSFRGIIDNIAAVHKEKPNVKFQPRTRDKVDQGFDITKLYKTLPDFTPVDLQEGI